MLLTRTPETIWELLRPFLHPIRTVHSLLERSLVLRQARFHWFEAPVVQRRCPPVYILRLPRRLGNLPICYDILGYIQGFDDTAIPTHESAPGRRRVWMECQWQGIWRAGQLRDHRAAHVVGGNLPGRQHCFECVECLLVQSDGQSCPEAIYTCRRGAVEEESIVQLV